MNSEIKTRLINTFGTISYLIVIFFFFTLILFMHNDVEDALKESWVASIYFLSVLATLGAAYIASSLFNDWREQQKYQNLLLFAMKCNDSFFNFDKKFKSFTNELIMLESQFHSLTSNNINKYIYETNEISNRFLEILDSFDELHGNLLNFRLIDSNNIIKNDDLDSTQDSVIKYTKLLGDIKYQQNPLDRHKIIESLVNYPFSGIHNSIYQFFIRKIIRNIKTNLEHNI